MKVSVITPIHNEAPNIPELVRRIAATMDAWAAQAADRDWEQLACDDHSTDNSVAVLNGLTNQFPRLRVLKNPQRSGQTGGFQTGFRHADGDIAVTLDADLQNPPEEIPRLLEPVVAGKLDLVNAIRTRRQHSGLLIAISRLGNSLIQVFMTCPVSDAASNFTAVRAEFVRNVTFVENDHRYIIPICVKRGLNPRRIGEVATQHDARKHGASKYSALRKALTGFPELLRCKRRLRAGFYDRARVPAVLIGGAIPATAVAESAGKLGS